MLRSVRSRLTLWFTVVFAVSFLLVSVLIYEYISTILSDSLNQALTRETMWLAARMERSTERNEPRSEVQDEIFEHAAFYPEKEYIEIWDDSGKIFYHSMNLGKVDTLLSHIPPSNTSRIVTVPNFHDQEIRIATAKNAVATVYLAMPTDSITSPVSHLMRIFVWILPVVIVVALAAGTFFAKKSFSKINEVVKAAQHITADRLDNRIPPHHTDDEIGRVISTFNEMISRLDVSFAQMKQFSADASHELRTPLTVMRSQLETALHSGASLGEIRELVANCLDEALRMSSIIDNLLLLAKGDAQTIRQEPVDLRRLLRITYDESVILASVKSIAVTLEAPCHATVRGDEERLRQMLLNLIDNAIKYSPPNGTIMLKLSREDGRAAISVRDRGIGIPPSEIPRIFDRFYRVDRARSRELGGAGLGLSIAQWIVQAHGGTIDVKSDVNSGSQFTVFLPLAA